MPTPQDAYTRLDGTSMGTTWSVRLPATGGYEQAQAPKGNGAAKTDGPDNLAALSHAIAQALATVVDQMSNWQEDSVLSQLNRAERGWYQMPEPLYTVLACALDTARSSGGAYDPTLGELVKLWGFGPQGPRLDAPDANAIARALALSGWTKTQLNPKHRGVWQPGGLHFDLSAIAKGYGVDEIARILDEHGFDHYLAELGGELKGKGLNAQGRPWTVNIESPDSRLGALPVSLTNHAIATSGDYRRCFIVDGRRYAHTIDAQTGHPLPDDLASVSVLHPSCMQADAWATALLCMGAERGPAYARVHGIAAVFMKRIANDISLDWTPDFLALGQGAWTMDARPA